ncbi:MAG: excinuclease ABC subunit UvrC [Clostridiales bacterium]|nr:excinuclease ABC subunit UvrC [Clostridiales bacterium]
MNDILKQKLAALPDSPGSYIMKSGGRIIYVGKAVSLKNRVRSYFQQGRPHAPKVQAMVDKIDDFETILCRTELEALILENNLIKKHKPYYNILLKDDKTYPYVKADLKEAFPALRLVRRVEKDGAKYFGPYFGATMVREILDVVADAFPLRTCTRDMDKVYDRPCVRWEIGKCLGPCVYKLCKESYDNALHGAIRFLSGDTKAVVDALREKMLDYSKQMKFEQAAMVRDAIERIGRLTERQRAFSTSLTDRDAVAIAACGLDTVAQVLYIRDGRLSGSEYFRLENALEEETGEVLRDFLLQHYDDGQFIPKEILLETDCADMAVVEEILSDVRGGKVDIHVPQRGEKKSVVDMAAKNAKENALKLHERLSRKYERTMGASKELAEILGIPIPRRMECYDISNFQGDQSVASMVVFINGEPARKEYRHFKIKTVEGPNDFASMAEVITRRFTRLKNGDASFSDAPDLVIIDGGKGQLGYALEAFGKVDPPCRPHFFSLAEQFEEVYSPDSSDPIIIDRHSDALHLLQSIRDEAHRFAITHHRALRQKKTVHSQLDDIPGIGPARRRALLAHFKSYAAMSKATIEELTTVQGMNAPAAQAVYEHFRRKG